ncbi:MAG: gliding motility-associated C-terminal domain-containing protein [Chitinophagia bacterium]|jgi:gliding motility-associated-like protein
MTKILTGIIVLLCCIQSTVAQVCSGSLGDPIIWVTFGSDATPKGPLRSGVTNLTYTGSGCPADAQYAITNMSFGCLGNTWHLMVGDHTGDVGGRFMIVNASPDPNTFYVDTIKGLCSGVTYEMAAFVANVLKPSSCGGKGVLPNLTFTLENKSGTILHSYQTGDIVTESQKVWKKLGTMFIVPAGIDQMIMRITNNAPGGVNCGNDFAIDDITFRACGPVVAALANGSITQYFDVCEHLQQPIHFEVKIQGQMNRPLIQWQLSRDTGKTFQDISGERNAVFIRNNTSGGVYQYRAMVYDAVNAESPSCRFSSNVTQININPLPAQKSPTRFFGCTGSDFYLQSVEGPAYNYTWIGPNGFKSAVRDPIITNIQYADSGLYQVSILTDKACSRTDSFFIRVYPGAHVKVDTGRTICEGETVTLQASGEGSFVWLPNVGLSNNKLSSPLATPMENTYYQVMLSNQYGCKDSAIVLIKVLPIVRVDAGEDIIMFEGDTVSLKGKISGEPLNFYWLPDRWINNAQMLHPVISPQENIQYILNATSPYGCPIQQDVVQIFVYKKLRIPNSFSPNGDGINDRWVIENGNVYPNATVSVFGRNGRLVYSGKVNAANWDGYLQGKLMPVGTYYYVIDLGINRPPVTGWIWLIW